MESNSEAGTQTEVEALFTSVRDTLAEEAKDVNFAIGGKIDLQTQLHCTAPLGVTIRWDSKTQGRKVTLPLNDQAHNDFDWLVHDAEPATFGVGSQEVLDESYRKAGKMDEDKFCTNFNPYEHMIMDVVTQALVQRSDSYTGTCGARAELYKLNLYPGPLGRFKAHVDTPRSEEQMGSLVVCLPYSHKGGQLAVRLLGREVVFDWASESSTSIQWAAFFSDCEHEVLEVTEGHRITLTYNLFWTTHGPNLQGDRLGAVDLKSTLFFPALEKLLDCPDFYPKGGLIGFTCTHAYPHSSFPTTDELQHTLKGIDMLVYQALRLLVGNARFSAVLDDSGYQRALKEQADARMEYYGVQSDDSSEAEPEDGSMARFATMAPTTSRIGPPLLWDEWEEDVPPNPEQIAGTRRTNPDKTLEREQVYECREVTWLNFSPGAETARELAVAFLTPGLDAYYSSAVIIAELQGME